MACVCRGEKAARGFNLEAQREITCNAENRFMNVIERKENN